MFTSLHYRRFIGHHRRLAIAMSAISIILLALIIVDTTVGLGSLPPWLRRLNALKQLMDRLEKEKGELAKKIRQQTGIQEAAQADIDTYEPLVKQYEANVRAAEAQVAILEGQERGINQKIKLKDAAIKKEKKRTDISPTQIAANVAKLKAEKKVLQIDLKAKRTEISDYTRHTLNPARFNLQSARNSLNMAKGAKSRAVAAINKANIRIGELKTMIRDARTEADQITQDNDPG